MDALNFDMKRSQKELYKDDADGLRINIYKDDI